MPVLEETGTAENAPLLEWLDWSVSDLSDHVLVPEFKVSTSCLSIRLYHSPSL